MTDIHDKRHLWEINDVLAAWYMTRLRELAARCFLCGITSLHHSLTHSQIVVINLLINI